MSKPSRTQDTTPQTNDPAVEPDQAVSSPPESPASSDALLAPDTTSNPSLKNN
ncbi:hypothetical protein [Frateuria sp.]|uniref:hypothetical protein n=1 Tax=Frateuria sp. TaxID=2211372 RepID=UPI0018471136|nr:hypothetical protein [Frateuria sp.]NUR21283.1 hypothetical protein [Frateuria sp.]